MVDWERTSIFQGEAHGRLYPEDVAMQTSFPNEDSKICKVQGLELCHCSKYEHLKSSSSNAKEVTWIDYAERPQVSSSQPVPLIVSKSCNVSALAGVLVVLSVTNSTPSIRPLPLTFPMTTHAQLTAKSSSDSQFPQTCRGIF